MAEAAISKDNRYRARPTVRIDGENRLSVSKRVNTFRVVEHEGGLSSLEMRLANERGSEAGASAVPFAFEDERDLALGSRITLFTGDEWKPREVFRGVVTSIEAEFTENGPAELIVLAEDALQSGRLARRSKVYDDLKIKSLAGDIATALSLTPKVTGFDSGLGVQVQLNESDLAFLRRMLRRYDGDVQVVGGELHVSPRKDVSRGTIELERDGQLRRARFVVDLAHQVTEVTTAGYDSDNGQRVTGTSSGANIGPGRGRKGADLLRDKLQNRSEHVGYPPVHNKTVAQAVADAAFDERARKFVVAHLTTEGNPQIRVGTKVVVKGTSKRFDNTYYVVHATHRFDLDRGYETDCEAECAYLGNP
jgi:phage protein D